MPDMPTRLCDKVNHFNIGNADQHAAHLRAKGYERAVAYKCRHCPFWHVTKGQRHKAATMPKSDHNAARRKDR